MKFRAKARFFHTPLMDNVLVQDVGTAILFLTSKSEECPKRLEYIVRAWYRLRVEFECPPKEVDRTSAINKDLYHKLCEYIVWLENVVLQTIGFNFSIDIPHPFVLRAKDVFRKNDGKFAEAVFWLTTDIIHITNWCIRYKPAVIACAAFYMAIIWSETNTTLPGKNAKGDDWMHFFDPTITMQQLEEMTVEFLQLWRHIDPKVIMCMSKFDHSLLAERVRRNQPGSSNSTPNTNTTTESSPASSSSISKRT